VVGALALCTALLALRHAIAEDPLARLHGDETGLHGSWWFPRGGPYILGFEAPGGGVGELEIDGVRVVAGAERQTARVVYAAGAHGVTFRGPAGARLLWHPPGRRGALEYVPPSSLSAEPPASAHFGAGAGASRGDAAIASLIVLILAAAGVLLARPKLDRRTVLVVGGVFVFALIVRLYGLSAAGQTWDEDEYWSAGRNYLVNLLSLDFSDASWRWNFEHPPITKYIGGLGALWQDGYDVARALFAALSAGTCALAAAIAMRLFPARDAVGHYEGARERLGMLAGIACALTPHLIGHAHVVGHETPSTFFWALAIYLCLRVHQDGRETRARRLVWVGVVLGLAAATRFSNLLLAPVIGITLLVWAPPPQRLRTLWMGAVITPLAGLAAFVLVWPRLWTHPFLHLHEAWLKLRLPHTPEPYLGTYTTAPTWHYFVVYTLAVTPVVLLALTFGGGVWRGIARRERGWLVVLAWLVAPYGIAWSPVRQDGVRYVLPALVPLAIAAAAGLDQLCVAIEPRIRRAPAALSAALAAYLLLTCARIHPYYLDYFAEAVGGAGRVQEQNLFETGWWGEGIGEAVDVVNASAAPDAKLYKLVQPTHVNWFRDDLFRHEVSSPTAADWIVVNDAGVFANDVLAGRPKFQLPADAQLVHDVRAGGASLVRVYRLRPQTP
jgi:4-amino-4-deoxy-L-arabinose transferase-like glycosyltransferase